MSPEPSEHYLGQVARCRTASSSSGFIARAHQHGRQCGTRGTSALNEPRNGDDLRPAVVLNNLIVAQTSVGEIFGIFRDRRLEFMVVNAITCLHRIAKMGMPVDVITS